MIELAAIKSEFAEPPVVTFMFMKTPSVRFHPHALAVLTLLLLISHPAGADFHVTLNGLDGNSGSAAKPFATEPGSSLGHQPA